tara:strand:+ start:581 stop:973 length:393 start_codon:yes stop_codon:yes gene_type:complete
MAALLTAQAAGADGPLFSRKFYGYIGLGLSGWMFAESIEARGDADEAYERYKQATTGADAQTFFDESRRFDTRTVVMGAMGVGALWWSVKMLRAQPPRQELMALQVKGIDLEVAGDLLRQRVRLTMSKDF